MHGRVAGLALAALLLPAAPAAAEIPAGNLLANPGAEAGPGAPDAVTIDPPPGWTNVGNVTAVLYGSPDSPTAADSAALGGGANFFAGGPDTAASAATQTLDVSGAAPEIDAGGVTATVAGDFGGYVGQDDSATLTATFLNAAGAPLGAPLVTPAVTLADRNGATALLPRSASGTVPAGTRTIAARLDMVRVEGAYDDGYADNLSLTLGAPPEPVFHKTVVAGVVSGTIRFRAPGAKSFVTLTADQALPLGSTLDTRHGVMELSSVPRAGANAQTSRFYSGLFKVTQPGRVTQVALTQPLARCGRAPAAAKKPKTRRLWGDGSGSFRTKGQYSSATVRGTRWLVQDSCAGTLTKVVRGVVSVRDAVRHKTVVLRAGKRYLARPRR